MIFRFTTNISRIMTPIFLAFSYKNKITIGDILSWLDTRLIKALGNPRGTNGIRRPVLAHGRLLRMPIVDSDRLPKDTAGRGLTSALGARNLVEETQRKCSDNLTGQARQMTNEIRADGA